MNEWWRNRKAKSRKGKKNSGEHTFIDSVLELLLWIPEFALLPFRMVFWLFRGIGKLISHIVDVV
ncbi:hypothetical protein [Virgibacillus sp. DJP39]|uniref:hypothetical protein n=1 Tax=Virgibacillus sp. DJP39 TaxID=3409790 RepID=UPI003BB7F822